MRIILTVILALASTTALAAGDWPPPKRFNYPFKGRVIVHNYLPPQCWRTISCANMDPYYLKRLRECHIYKSWFVTGRYWTHVVFPHEQAHCNGWPANHPR